MRTRRQSEGRVFPSYNQDHVTESSPAHKDFNNRNYINQRSVTNRVDVSKTPWV